jgi:UbiA prenyltransferase family
MLSISKRLLPLLQLTRMALVFTAIADSQCALLLRWSIPGWRGPMPASLGQQMLAMSPAARRAISQQEMLAILGQQMLAMALVSVGLYGFGMSLNDIIDRRRDAQIAAGRPLPSGRVGIITAHVICIILALMALLGGGYYARIVPGDMHGWLSFALVIGTGLLIAFYDAAGKYLVGPGLLSLGFIRFCHAVIPSPELPLLWQPLLLLNHVTILSTVAYVWEEKRPALTRIHWWGVLGGLALFDALAISVVAWRRYEGSVAGALQISDGLMLPLAAAMLFVAVAATLRRTAPTRRVAGQKLMLFGLLWLIVYDACFAGIYVGALAGVLLFLLLPVAYFSVQLMRGWSQLLALSQPPRFQRAGMKDNPPRNE